MAVRERRYLAADQCHLSVLSHAVGFTTELYVIQPEVYVMQPQSVLYSGSSGLRTTIHMAILCSLGQ